MSSTSSNSTGSCIAQFLAGLAGVVFVVVTVLVLVALPTEAQLFNPKAYKDAFSAQNLYERLPGLIATIPVTSDSSDNPENDARYLTSKDMEVIFQEILPPEEAKSLTEEIIDQTLAYYNSTDPNAKIQISMVDLKSRLKGENGDRIMRQVVASWPPCTEIENEAWRKSLAASEGSWPECSPSQDILDEATPTFGQVFDEMAASIPDVADMTPKYTTPSEDPRPTLMTIRWIIKLSPLLTAFLLAVVTVLAVRSLKGLVGWWGTLFLITGAITFLMAAFSGLMVEGMINAMVTEVSTQGETGGELVLPFLEIIRTILRGTGIQITLLAVLSGVMGLAMVVVAFILGRNKHTTSDPYTTLPG